jgi:cytochrome P450
MNEQSRPSKGAPLFNPWSPEFIANPYPSYHLLRENEPMHYMPLGLYVASRHADVATILRDKRFGKDFIGRMALRATNTRRTGLSQHEPLDAATRSA